MVKREKMEKTLKMMLMMKMQMEMTWMVLMITTAMLMEKSMESHPWLHQREVSHLLRLKVREKDQESLAVRRVSVPQPVERHHPMLLQGNLKEAHSSHQISPFMVILQSYRACHLQRLTLRLFRLLKTE